MICIVQARLSSKRLPGKVIKNIFNIPILLFLIKRLKKAKNISDIIVATSNTKDDEKIIQGAEAFLILWKKIPKYRFLYNFFKLPIIFNLFSFGYEIIAFFLYLKNKKQLKN